MKIRFALTDVRLYFWFGKGDYFMNFRIKQEQGKRRIFSSCVQHNILLAVNIFWASMPYADIQEKRL